MRRRDVLRTLGGATLAGATGLSGCLHSSDSDLGQEEMGAVGETLIDGLDVIGWESTAHEDEFEVDFLVENVGEESTDASEYTYRLDLYDDADTQLSPNTWQESVRSSNLDPGDETTITVIAGGYDEAATVERYEILVNCWGPRDFGAYCPIEQEDHGSLGTNAIEDFEVRGWFGRPSGTQYDVHIVVQNTGDRTADYTEYTIELTLFDGAGTELDASVSPTLGPHEVDPGETHMMTATANFPDDEPPEVTSFEFDLTCSGSRADGVYCP